MATACTLCHRRRFRLASLVVDGQLVAVLAAYVLLLMAMDEDWDVRPSKLQLGGLVYSPTGQDT